jgi:hypothetical protein
MKPNPYYRMPFLKFFLLKKEVDGCKRTGCLGLIVLFDDLTASAILASVTV